MAANGSQPPVLVRVGSRTEDQHFLATSFLTSRGGLSDLPVAGTVGLPFVPPGHEHSENRYGSPLSRIVVVTERGCQLAAAQAAKLELPVQLRRLLRVQARTASASASESEAQSRVN